MLSTVLLAFAGVAAPPAQVLEFDLSYTSKLGHVDRFEHTHTAAVRSPWNLSVNCRPAQLALIYAPPPHPLHTTPSHAHPWPPFQCITGLANRDHPTIFTPYVTASAGVDNNSPADDVWKAFLTGPDEWLAGTKWSTLTSFADLVVAAKSAGKAPLSLYLPSLTLSLSLSLSRSRSLFTVPATKLSGSSFAPSQAPRSKVSCSTTRPSQPPRRWPPRHAGWKA